MPATLDQNTYAVRRFNRFYTRQIGILEERLYQSKFSLAEVRVLYELAHRPRTTATELGKDLGLDAGYLSRMLRSFDRDGLIAKRPPPPTPAEPPDTDTQRPPSLRPAQRQLATKRERPVSRAAHPAANRTRALDGIDRKALGRATRAESPVPAPPASAGRHGWVVHRHGVLYSQEYKYDERFEALVAGIVAEFIQNFDPKRERC